MDRGGATTQGRGLAPLKSMQARLLAGVLVGALLAVLVALWVVRTIAQPISDLSLATANLGHQPLPLDHPALMRRDEIGDLAGLFARFPRDCTKPWPSCGRLNGG